MAEPSPSPRGWRRRIEHQCETDAFDRGIGLRRYRIDAEARRCDMRREISPIDEEARRRADPTDDPYDLIMHLRGHPVVVGRRRSACDLCDWPERHHIIVLPQPGVDAIGGARRRR
jgi:hypothetical protein